MTYEPSALAAGFARLSEAEPWATVVVSGSRQATRATIAALVGGLGPLLSRGAPGLVSGVPPGLIGLSAPNGPAFLAGLIALRERGHGVVLLDPLLPAAEARRACAAVGASGLLSCATGWPRDAGDWRLDAIAPASTSPSTSADGAAAALDLSRVGFVKLTSGSTGAPRGVAATEAALLADDGALARTMGLRADDRILAAIPMSHSYGLSSVALPALVRGSTVVVPGGDGPLAPLAAADAARATVWPSAPSYLHALLKLSQPPPWPSSLRLVLSASAPLPPETAAQFRARFGLPVHVFYGASECGGICYDREGTAAERGTVGEPVEGVSVSLDPVEDELQDARDEGGVGEGLAGLVRVESPSVALGYLPTPDPRLSGGRFRTSDLAVLEGRELRLRGRADGLINVKGRKVDPGEIEAVLQALSGVAEAVVFGVPSADRASDTVRAVIACPSGGLSYDDVVAWCRARLPEHKVPRSILLVSAIPRTARGKVSRAELLALAGGRPGGSRA